jgi:tetratricopeptide (TPR) repeat protein
MVAADSLGAMHLESASPLKITASPDYAGLFRRRILTNAHYWRDFVAERADDVTALDGEREGILKALAFALDLHSEAWPWVYDLMVSFSPYMERRGHWESWNELLDRAIRVAGQGEDQAGTVTLSILFARLWQRQSRPRETISHYRRAIHLARRIEDEFSEARACSNLGFLYAERSQWWRAEILCCHALAIFERLDSVHGRAHTENHLGFLHTRQGFWEQAKRHLEQACGLWQGIGDSHGLMRGFINLGMLFNEMKRSDESISCLTKALQQAKLSGEEGEIGTIYMNMGVAYRLKSELVQAEVHICQAEAIFRRFSNSLGLALTWINLGLVYIKQNRWKEAKQYLEAALQVCRNLRNEYGEIEALLGMMEYELARKNHKQARAKLKELENFLQSHNGGVQYQGLQLLLVQYRRNFAGFSSDKIAAD